MSIKFYSILVMLLFITTTSINSRSITLLLDPAEKSTHQAVGNLTEHAITIQLCQNLKKVLEHHYPSFKIIITPPVPELSQPHKKASFANTLQPDLLLNFSCFYKAEGRPLLTIYHYGLQPATDSLTVSHNYLSFIPYQKAYLKAFGCTKKIAHETLNFFNAEYKKNFECNAVYACPLLPLKGIMIPALTFEMGLQNSNDWKLFIEPLVEFVKRNVQFITDSKR